MPGMDIPPVRAFATGYKAGALTGGALQDRDVKVLDSTIGSFTDPVKAKTLAHQLLNQDADILFALAGLSGLGVIKAVEEDEARNFVIGVDVDQDDISPGNVLASVLKRNDLVIADQIVKIYEDEFTGGTKDVGVKNGYIHLSEMKHTKHLVPPQGLAALEGAKVLLAEEQFTIPRTEKGLAGFTPPVQRLR
jgi:basic membrane protein A